MTKFLADHSTLVSSAELQARRKALLAPVQRYRRGWVQLRTDSAYKVLKWVPRDSVPGTTIGLGHLESFLDENDEIDASSDDEEEEGEEEEEDGEDGEGRSGDESEVGVVASGRGRSTGEVEELHDSSATRSHAKGLKMERKTSKAVEDTERVGGQLAGLETGQIAEQIEVDDDEEEEEEEDLVPPPEASQMQPVPMEEDEQLPLLAAYPPPEPLMPSSLLADQQPSTSHLSSAETPGLEVTTDLSLPSYATTIDHQPPLGTEPIPPAATVYPTEANEIATETDQTIFSTTLAAPSEIPEEPLSAQPPA
ncbi:hypothetical protein PCANC_19059 [Puccinia coronata f. sp. avenae]|uniref:Uncharacterized protein n=1 Tax=Puccinia coronata f. sp. avenae TaxID=200324 RepID=A0A2N5UCW1_9BASI|nr:hypothetical protein PCANC_24863 [Puccinia coronata f. sp. avenae]PLW35592.1 hypothetical protein PCANC_19059 [Puccinia coronata f. sp. avenae]